MKSRTNASQVSKMLDVLSMVDDYTLPVEEYLDRTYGIGTWKLDPYAGQYVVCDTSYRGPGRGYVIVSRDTREFQLILMEQQLH
jgi:hypothetical protein